MEKLNPEWHINEIGKIRPFVMWTLRFHVMSILYNHRDPDTFDDASSKSEKEKDDNQIVGLSLFQAVKLKNLSRKIKTFAPPLIALSATAVAPMQHAQYNLLS